MKFNIGDLVEVTSADGKFLVHVGNYLIGFIGTIIQYDNKDDSYLIQDGTDTFWLSECDLTLVETTPNPLKYKIYDEVVVTSCDGGLTKCSGGNSILGTTGVIKMCDLKDRSYYITTTIEVKDTKQNFYSQWVNECDLTKVIKND